jgi:site-specific DNA-methyltransferase (adenine-specific)
VAAGPESAVVGRFRAPGGAPIALYQGDALDRMAHALDPGSVDVVVTSPPYNLGVAYGAYDDRRPREQYLAWTGEVARGVARVLADQGSFFLNVGSPATDPWRAWDVAREVGRCLTLQNVIVWVKSIAIERRFAGARAALGSDLALGHYKPLPSERFLHGAHEYVFHFTHHGDVRLDRKAAGVAYQDKSNIARWAGAGSDRRCRGNVWFLPYATIRRRADDRPHPASFPAELPERCLQLHGIPRTRLALDPFVGIGASAVAAARCGVPFVGVDLDGAYLEEAARRLLDAGATVDPSPTSPARVEVPAAGG